ncbi:MAG: hypothetical protein MAG458_01236 [Nitrosopumilus sp.]|nr:hypothetical protein [Nitrosopumilus sp.]
MIINVPLHITNQDAEMLKDFTCNICGKKLTIRLELCDVEGLNVFAVCYSYFSILKKSIINIQK